MSGLFNRVCSVQISSRLITDLRMSFKVKKKLKKGLNNLELKVYGLSGDTRRQLAKEGEFVQLIAGYDPDPETIFTGDAMQVYSYKEGTEWITVLESSDGIRKKRESRTSRSFSKGTPVSTAITKVAGDTGYGIGNAVEQLKQGNLKGGLTSFVNGFVAVGSAVDEMDKMIRNYGYDWSVQDGQLQIIKPDGVVDNDIVLLSEETGMIGSPEVSDNDFVKVRCLIQQRLVPGRAVQLVSEQYDGIYRIEETDFVGDTHGNDWYADLELSAVS